MNSCKEKHICHCGTSTVEGGHEVGTHGCVRRLVKAPRKVRNGWEIMNRDGNKKVISDFTLRQQRGYHQYECGCWSNNGTSANSLEGDW